MRFSGDQTETEGGCYERRFAQVVGAIVGAGVLYIIASGNAGWVPNGFASNGYGDMSPGKYDLGACFLTEFLATFFFLFIIIGATSKGAAVGFEPDHFAHRNAAEKAAPSKTDI